MLEPCLHRPRCMICGFMHHTDEKSSIGCSPLTLNKPVRHREEIIQEKVDYYSVPPELKLEDLIASIRKFLELGGEQLDDNE